MEDIPGLHYKKLILSALVGLLSGGLAGVAANIISPPRAELGSVQASKGAVLVGTCVGGGKPEIRLSWELPGSETINQLRRQKNTQTEIYLISQATPPFKTSYVDTDVISGEKFSYRVQTSGEVFSNTVTIEATVRNCVDKTSLN